MKKKEPVGDGERAQVLAVPKVDARVEQDLAGALRQQLVAAAAGLAHAHAHHVRERELELRQRQTPRQPLLARHVRLRSTDTHTHTRTALRNSVKLGRHGNHTTLQDPRTSSPWKIGILFARKLMVRLGCIRLG